MSTLEINAQLGLMEILNRLDGGSVMPIAERLKATNRILDFLPWKEANQETGHKLAVRTAEPSGSWRKLNAGVAAETSSTKNVTEAIGMLETYSRVDAAAVKLSRDPVAFRSSEDIAFINGLSKAFATALIYADTDTEPEKFEGLAARLPSLSTNHVISAGGSGSDLASVYVIEVGENAVYGIYPRGSMTAGLEMEDKGQQTVEGPTSSTWYEAFVTHFMWHCGIVVTEPARNIHRVANIETSGTSNILDEDDLIVLINELRDDGAQPLILCNRTIHTQLDILAKDKTNASYTVEEVFGRRTVHFRGVPIVRMDAMLNTESAVS